MLTDVTCKNAKCPDDRLRARYTDERGLYLEVTRLNTPGQFARLWRWKYRFGLVEKRLALGSYPEVSLVQARKARDAARALLRDGKDPAQLRKDAKLLTKFKLGNSFEIVARQWHDHWKGPRSPRHAGYVLRRLELDVFPKIGKKPISNLTAPDILAVAKSIEQRGALDIARRVWQTIGQVCEYAIAHGVLTRNPSKDVKPSVALKPREKQNFARIEAKELPELLRKIDAYRGTPYTRFALKLMSLTFVRTNELTGARWDEFDLDAAEWRIPAERMKMKTPHIVPLSGQSLEVLRCLQEVKGLSDYVFPGERNHETSMSDGTILGALKRMGYTGRMTGHGFRGLASTILHEKGFDHAHIELQLAHQERNRVSASYNHATHLDGRKTMMQAWADHLDASRRGAQVLAFKVA